MAISAILLPFILAFLSDKELGLWYVFAGISSLVALLDFGFTPTIARNIAYSWSGAKNLSLTDVDNIEIGFEIDWRVFAVVLRTCKTVFLAISLVALFVMLSLGTYYVYVVSDADLGFVAAWAVYAISIFLNLLYGYISAYLRGMGAVAENAKATAISKICQLVITGLLLYLDFGIMGTSIGYLLSCIVLRFLLFRYFSKDEEIQKNREKLKIRVPFKDIISSFRIMWHNAWRDGLVSFAMFLSTQANTLICSVVLGLSSTGFYGLAMQVATVISSVGAVWYSTIQPKLQECAVSRNDAEAQRLFSTSIVVFLIVGISGCLLFIAVGPFLLDVLRGGMDVDWLMFAAVCIYMLIYRGNILCVSCLSNYNIVPYAKAYVITGIVSVLSSFLCAALFSFGLWSLILPPLVVLLMYNAWKWPCEALRKMGSPSIGNFLHEGFKGIVASVRSRKLG